MKQFQKYVPRHKIAKTLKIPPSTVHNINNRSGRVSVLTEQGWRSKLDVCDLSLKNMHDSLFNITAWAQEHFQKSLSVNTVGRATHKCKLKLYYAKKKPYMNMIQKCNHFLSPNTNLRWSEAKWKTVLWSDDQNLKFFLKNMNMVSCRLKRRETIQLVIGGRFKSLYL